MRTDVRGGRYERLMKARASGIAVALDVTTALG
jgi:hypothetical protein